MSYYLRTALSIALIFGLAVVSTAVSLGFETCLPWTDRAYGYSVCLPVGWYKRPMPSGALFLCDDKKGACTTPVGGTPLVNHATLSVIPAEVALEEVSTSLEQFAHRVSDKDPSSHFSHVVSISRRSGAIKYIVVSQTFATGARNEVPQIVCRYFVETGQKMFEFILTFNSGDRRSRAYRDTVLRVIASVRLER